MKISSTGCHSGAQRSAKLPGPPARTLKLGKTRMAAPVSFSRWFGKDNLRGPLFPSTVTPQQEPED